MMKKLVVLGAGESGLGSALLAKRNKYDVFVSDSSEISDQVKNKLVESGIDFEENSHQKAKTLKPNFIVKSPGISDANDIVKFFISTSVKIISEIEFASLHCNSKIIGVTGSNGKTTTTTLAYKLISEGGYNCTISGNIGNSFSNVCENDTDFSIVEVSSFQLDGIESFKPHIAILTAITPDHLDDLG